MSDANLKAAKAVWWDAECLKGDPARNPRLVDQAFRAGWRAALDVRATPSPPPTEGARVRISVATNSEGKWMATGASDDDDAENFRILRIHYGMKYRAAIIAATIPLPKLAEIEGAVEAETK